MKNNFYHQVRTSLVVFLLLSICLYSSCKKNAEVLTPTEIPEKNIIIPQGNNDYDQRILDYYKRFGTFILYKFTQQDINWKPGSYLAGYKSVPADEAYVNLQLDLLDKTFFKYYQDSTLKEYLPIKLFLCSSLRLGSVTKELAAFLITPTEAATLAAIEVNGYQGFAVNWGRKAILNISSPVDSIGIFRSDVNYSFIKMADIQSKISRSEDFLNASDYVSVLTAATSTERYKRGFIGLINPPSVTTLADWYTYLRAITSTSYANLTNPTTPATDVTYNGILNPLKDQNGLIRKKYDFMVNFYKSRYNIDIQAIGNGE